MSRVPRGHVLLPRLPLDKDEVERLSSDERDRLDGSILYFFARLPEALRTDPVCREGRWKAYRELLMHDANKQLFDKLVGTVKPSDEQSVKRDLDHFQMRIGRGVERTLFDTLSAGYL